MIKKILIITYYWPPSAGGGVQRWLKFVKYLPDFDWEPIVFTPENPDFEIKDASLLRDIRSDQKVIEYPIWEPFAIYKQLTGWFRASNRVKQGMVISSDKQSTLERIMIWLRGNLLIPDARRFWIKPSVKYLVQYLRENPTDVVVTTGPPHSMHLIGEALKKKTGVKWVADFRDPWSDWDILDDLKVTSAVRSIHRSLEKRVIHECDGLLAVTEKLAQHLSEKKKNIAVITNGVDPDDSYKARENSILSDKFMISHFGLLNDMRNPELLWDALDELCVEIPEFRNDLIICLAGAVDAKVFDRMNSSAYLSQVFEYREHIDHDQVFDYLRSSNLLLLLMNRSANADLLIPGKFFELLYAGQEILALGSETCEVHEMLMSLGGRGVCQYSDKEEIKKVVLKAYLRYQSGESFVGYQNTEKYFRRNLTKSLATFLDQVLQA